MNKKVEEVFVTEGLPDETFVQPPNYNELLVDIRNPGKPVIIEGQSGTGKTTTVKKILEQIGNTARIGYLTARKPVDVKAIATVATARTSGTFVIDDFHRLPEDLRSKLADIAKLAAEEGVSEKLPKLIIIGINQVGSALIQLVPDIAKRCGIHKIKPGDRDKILALIDSGCKALGVEFSDKLALFSESRGDYWLAQQLCQTACTAAGVLEAQDTLLKISIDLPALRSKVVDKLKSAYYPAIKEFCRGRRFRPSNDPYFKLLKKISESGESVVDLTMLANSSPDVRGSINNIKERRLGNLLESKPIASKYFFYDSETTTFAVEDPAVFYCIEHLDWEELRKDCGFKDLRAKDYEFDIAISFAGENRALAKHLADQFEVLDAHVFFDESFESNFLGKAWNSQFKRIFADDSRFVVCILDKHHHDKIWPTFERECFTPRVADGDVLPIYLDDTKFVGIPSDIVGIKFSYDPGGPDTEWKTRAIDEIVFKVFERMD